MPNGRCPRFLGEPLHPLPEYIGTCFSLDFRQFKPSCQAWHNFATRRHVRSLPSPLPVGQSFCFSLASAFRVTQLPGCRGASPYRLSPQRDFRSTPLPSTQTSLSPQLDFATRYVAADGFHPTGAPSVISPFKLWISFAAVGITSSHSYHPDARLVSFIKAKAVKPLITSVLPFRESQSSQT